MIQSTAERFDQLTDVLHFAHKNNSKFTVGECIMINQERGRLLAKLAGTPDARPPYTVPKKIETRIREVTAWINR